MFHVNLNSICPPPSEFSLDHPQNNKFKTRGLKGRHLKNATNRHASKPYREYYEHPQHTINDRHFPKGFTTQQKPSLATELSNLSNLVFELDLSYDDGNPPPVASVSRRIFKPLLRSLRELPPGSRKFIAGGLAGAVAKTATAPLEAVKLQLVQSRIGAWEAAQMIYHVKGPWGFFAGNTLDILRTVPSKGLELATFEAYKRAILSWRQKSLKDDSTVQMSDNAAIAAVAGALAGITATLAIHPLETIRTRLAISKEPLTFIGCVSDILKTKGPGGLFNGVYLSLLKQGPQYALGFAAYEQCKRALAL